jgi:hypothetical protein
MGVNHGGFDIFVAQQFLDGADVVAVLQEMSGKTMAEGVASKLPDSVPHFTIEQK